jgi:hypothetical protein
MYGLLYPAVLGTVFFNLFPSVWQLIEGQPVAGPQQPIKLLLTLGIVFHFIVDYVLAQEAPDGGWRGFILEFCMLIALWTAAASAHLDSTRELDIRMLCSTLAAVYAFFLLWLALSHKQIQHKALLVTVEVAGLLWFLIGAFWINTWTFAVTGLFVLGALLGLAADRLLRRNAANDHLQEPGD